MTRVLPGQTRRPEVKVVASTWVSVLFSSGLAVLNAVVANGVLLGALPGWLQFLLIAVLPPVAIYLGGFFAPHTIRGGAGSGRGVEEGGARQAEATGGYEDGWDPAD